jgi:hypothetical protein
MFCPMYHFNWYYIPEFISMYSGTRYYVVLCLHKFLARKTCLSWRFSLPAKRVSGPWHIKCDIGKQIDQHAILHRNQLFRTYKRYPTVWGNNFRASFSKSVLLLGKNTIEDRIFYLSNIYHFGENNGQTCKMLHSFETAVCGKCVFECKHSSLSLLSLFLL